jgi:hypothetical protein
MKFAVLALLGLVAVQAIKFDLPTEDEDQVLLAEDNEEFTETNDMQAEMIQTEAVTYTKTNSTKEGLVVDTLVLPGTNPGKTLILCHGAGKGKDYFTTLDAKFAFAPTANLQIMIPNSAHHEKWKKGMKTPWFTKRKSGSVKTYNNYKEWSVEESADAVARIVMGEVKRYAKLYKETEKKAAKRVFLAGQS